ncbi:hypothetical protein LTR94_032273, partial [Friedmanniomyces endolithicus]
MKNIHAIVAASSLALLASCGRGSAETAKAPPQAEEIAEFCNHMATVAATSSASPVALMGQIQNKIIEEEWDTDTVVNECAEALRRKAEFMRQQCPMRTLVYAALAAGALAVSGCASAPARTPGSYVSQSEPVFLITEAQADQILVDAMNTEFGNSPI